MDAAIIERLVAALPCGASVWRAESGDPGDLRLLYANPACVRRGLPPASAAPGTRLAEIDGASQQQVNGRSLGQIMLDVAVRQESHTAEFSSVEAGRQDIPHRVVCVPLGEGLVATVCEDPGGGQDVRTALQQSKEDYQSFVYAVSHDLKEPLHIISGYAQVLERRAGEQIGPARQYLENVIRGVEQMDRMLDALLEFSRVTTEGHMPRAVPAERPLLQAISRLERNIAEAGATITHDPLPTVLVDEAQLLSIYHHLLINALRFRSESPLKVHVSARPADGFHAFQVSDNGIGFEPRHAEAIFEVFRRLNRRRPEGVGMGLPICRRIVERHGGRMWAESMPGQGSTFHFTLPGAREETE
jgi:signal transduction histidine kinase